MILKEKVTIEVKLLTPDAKMPTKAHEHDSGYDVYALNDVLIPAKSSKNYKAVLIHTGVAFNTPDGYEWQVRPKSGIGTKTSARVVFGTGDGPYRGEYMVQVDNYGHGFKQALMLDGKFTEKEYEEEGYVLVRKGDKIAQLVLAEVVPSSLKVVDTLTETERNAGGFGSTGIL